MNDIRSLRAEHARGELGRERLRELWRRYLARARMALTFNPNKLDARQTAVDEWNRHVEELNPKG